MMHIHIYEHYFENETLERLAKFGDEENKQMIFGGRKEFFGSQSMQFGQRKLIKQIYQLLPSKFSARDLEKLLKNIVSMRPSTAWIVDKK